MVKIEKSDHNVRNQKAGAVFDYPHVCDLSHSHSYWMFNSVFLL
jgi:hypothetical protein